MVFKALTSSVALLVIILVLNSYALPNNHTDDLVNAAIDAGTFQDPSVKVRPRFRYWPPDASINLTRMADDIQGLGGIGAGGVELLGYYLYGGGQGSYAPDDWSVYGWGTPSWVTLMKAALIATYDSGLQMDFAMGPNQGQGVPAVEGSEGLAWDIILFNSSVATGGLFNRTLPGWGALNSNGTWSLLAVTTALVTNSYPETTVTLEFGQPVEASFPEVVLAADSLQDITDLARSDGTITYQFPNTNGTENILFATYMYHSNYRAQTSPLNTGGPQTPPQNFVQNGSFAVDHFSSAGAKLMTDFWEDYILTDESVKSLLETVGNYGWEDSIEILNNVYWTKHLLSDFLKRRGYSLAPYLPTLFHDNSNGVSGTVSAVQYVTDEADKGILHRDDYRQTLAEGYRDYITNLTSWANKVLDVQFSAQVSYNLPMDMEDNIPFVNAPECESLGFDHDIDQYRQFAGPANLAGKRVISNEMGANFLEAYATYVPEILWDVKRAFVSGINQMVFHGATYSGNYGNTTWPGFTTFTYLFSEMYSRHQPAFNFYSDTMDYVARMQLITQSGVPKRDIAFYNLKTSYTTLSRTYIPTDLERAGYTYEYLSPNNFNLPNAIVRQNILAPDAQAFKALVIRANDTMTAEAAAWIGYFAVQGLPIIFSGGLPGSVCSCNLSASNYVTDKVLSLARLPNVHQVPYENLAQSLLSLGIQPLTKFSKSLTWYTQWRKDTNKSADYAVVYYDALPGLPTASTQNVTFAATGYPYIFDAWTGQQTPVTTFTQSTTSTTIPLNLAGNQTVIIAFFLQPLPGTTNNSTTATTNRDVILLKDWTLVAENWGPPVDLYDLETVAVKSNTTHSLPSLVSWQEIPGLQNVSGLGYYINTFTMDPAASGAVIDFGPIVHTIRVYINGKLIPPLDLTWARADISQFLLPGVNIVEAVVSTPLGNGLRPIWTTLRTSGVGPAVPAPAPADYGLLGVVSVVLYS